MDNHVELENAEKEPLAIGGVDTAENEPRKGSQKREFKGLRSY